MTKVKRKVYSINIWGWNWIRKKDIPFTHADKGMIIFLAIITFFGWIWFWLVWKCFEIFGKRFKQKVEEIEFEDYNY